MLLLVLPVLLLLVELVEALQSTLSGGAGCSPPISWVGNSWIKLVLTQLVEALQQVLQHVVQEVAEVLLGEVLQLVLLELLAWVGGATRSREGQGLGSDLGLSTMLRVLSAPRGHGVCMTHSQI